MAAFDTVFRRQVAELKRQPGLQYVKLARRIRADGGEDAILFEEWRDAASMYAWVGPDLGAPRLISGSQELIDALVIEHYEGLDDDGFGEETSDRADESG